MKLSAILAIAMAGFSSCNKTNMDNLTPAGSGISAPADLTVSLGAISTKAGTTNSTASEDKVNTLQIFVFRKNGTDKTKNELDAYGTASNSKQLTLSCTSGSRIVYALVNAPALTAISTESALLASVSNLSDNQLDGFVMAGHVDNVSLPSQNTVSIDVSRIAARIKIKSIQKQFASPALQAQTLKVESIYVINASNKNNYALSLSATEYANKGSHKDNAYDNLLYKAIETASQTVASTYATEHSFYVYPNKSATKTRLVVEVSLGGNKYYYPITMPDIESNKSYEVSKLVLTRPGSNNPDVPVSFEDATFSINIVDWTIVPVATGDSGDYVI